METLILKPTKINIRKCAKDINDGEIVAFPTETVYGLGANAFNPLAVVKIYEAKGRPGDNPLIVHISEFDWIYRLCAEVPESAQNLFDLMPGPLTLIFRKKSIVPDVVTANMDTVGIRMPNHSVALEFIKECNCPICAPSANLSTSPSPTKAEHVFDDLNGKIKYIIDGGQCQVGLESTIVDFSDGMPRILRKGGIPIETLKERLGKISVLEHSDKALCPGMKYKHYSPKAQVFYCRYGLFMSDIIKQKYDELQGKKQIFCLAANMEKYAGCDVVNMGDGAEDYAHRIFDSFREADKRGYEYIILEGIEDRGIGSALINRAIKASGGKIL